MVQNIPKLVTGQSSLVISFQVSNVAEQGDGRECKLQTAAWQIVAIRCNLLPFVVFANCPCKLQIASGMHVTPLQTARGVQWCPNAAALSWVGDAPPPSILLTLPLCVIMFILGVDEGCTVTRILLSPLPLFSSLCQISNLPCLSKLGSVYWLPTLMSLLEDSTAG